MQFRDLKAQYNVLKEEIDQGIADVINNSNYINGKQVSELETVLAEYVGVKHCITCANGTDALSLALMACGIGPGDAVFVPDFTFFASGEVVSCAGATPIFVDVCEDTFNISAESLENAIKCIIKEGNLIPKAIIAVDLFGQPADYMRIRSIADKYHLFILEDGAQGFGGEINGRRACSFGDIATTSFFPAKPLGCYGDGGAIFTSNDTIADYLRSICVHGKGTSKYDNIRLGRNSRLDTLQAAILLPKFKAFCNYELNAVNQVAIMYTELLKDIVKTPIVPEGFYSSWAQYCILLPNGNARMQLQLELKEKGIPTMVYYPNPMHKQRAFYNKYKKYDGLSVASGLCTRVLALPMHPYIKEIEIENVVLGIKNSICFK